MISTLLQHVALLLLTASCCQAAHSRVHAFYYLWYDTPEFHPAGNYSHWNHGVLPHWTASVRAQYPSATFVPPADIHSPFYPARGPYSSRDPALIRDHLRDAYQHGIGVLVVSWWGRPGVSRGDSQGVVTDAIVHEVMRIAASAAGHARIALHMEPYEGRDIHSFRADLEYLMRTYADVMDAWVHVPRRTHTPTHTEPDNDATTSLSLPLIYVYDSYHIPASDWSRLLTPSGDLSIRGGPLDASVIGALTHTRDGQDALEAGFDGVYTYFATDGFSYGSTTANWPAMSDLMQRHGRHFIPCVGPGYDDTRIRPWNAANRRDRDAGAYYARMWNAALQVTPSMVGITSFNEWGEGTQIEDAVHMHTHVDDLAPRGLALDRATRDALRLTDTYSDYTPLPPDGYLHETRVHSRALAAVHGDTHTHTLLQALEEDVGAPDARMRRLERLKRQLDAHMASAEARQQTVFVEAVP